MLLLSDFFRSTTSVFTAAILLRIGLFFWGTYQDSVSAFKYTDIDYFVFTDAARFVAKGESPYARDTYRYTPLLAWMLLPTTWSRSWFSFGKILFAASDIIAGYLILLVLRSSYGKSKESALKFASIWLLNPMVATISTRGSSEGLLGLLSAALVWAVTKRQTVLAGVILGVGVHFKIYPFIYGVSIVWCMDEHYTRLGATAAERRDTSIRSKVVRFLNPSRITFGLVSLLVFMALNTIIYGWPFIEHSYLYHLTRIDHRHNFSPYSTVLYLNSSPAGTSTFRFESFAFLPQLFLSAVAIPLALAKKDLASTMLAQTFAFVTFNKVCTSQYFLWYLIFLPFYLPSSSMLQQPMEGIAVLVFWVLGQALWLQQAYQLEFLGKSTFIPGLWLSSLFFFLVNCWILGIVITDVSMMPRSKDVARLEHDKKNA